MAVTVTPSTAILYAGDKLQLAGTTTGSAIVWTSSDTSVTVVAGLVSCLIGKGVSAVTITATSDAGTATCVLTTYGISTGYVSKMIGRASSDVGTLCSYTGINKWSKKKPIPSITPFVLSTTKYWRSDGYVPSYAPVVRNGFIIEFDGHHSNYENVVWIHHLPSAAYDEVFRLGDFRGYVHNAAWDSMTIIDIPKEITLGATYTVTFTARGYNSYDTNPTDTGSTGLQDVFKLDLKYCTVGCTITNTVTTTSITKYGTQFIDDGSVHPTLYGANLEFSTAEMDTLTNGGPLYIEVFMIEADNSSLTNMIKYSLRTIDSVITSFTNRQFLASGIVLDTNWTSLILTYSNSTVINNGNLWISFNTANRTPGSTSVNYYFEVLVIDNQLGQSYIYNLPVISYITDSSYTWNIPTNDSATFPFSLSILNPSAAIITVRCKLWDGVPNSDSATVIDYHDFQIK